MCHATIPVHANKKPQMWDCCKMLSPNDSIFGRYLEWCEVLSGKAGGEVSGDIRRCAQVWNIITTCKEREKNESNNMYTPSAKVSASTSLSSANLIVVRLNSEDGSTWIGMLKTIF
jgi:hypothetical protein